MSKWQKTTATAERSKMLRMFYALPDRTQRAAVLRVTDEGLADLRSLKPLRHLRHRIKLDRCYGVMYPG